MWQSLLPKCLRLKGLPRFAVKDKNLANVRKGFRCKRLPQSRGSFAMTRWGDSFREICGLVVSQC